jgi:hypothetical protein
MVARSDVAPMGLPVSSWRPEAPTIMRKAILEASVAPPKMLAIFSAAAEGTPADVQSRTSDGCKSPANRNTDPHVRH